MKATLVIYGLDKMTKGQRGFLSRWLARQSKFIKPMHREFSGRYMAKVRK